MLGSFEVLSNSLLSSFTTDVTEIQALLLLEEFKKNVMPVFLYIYILHDAP